MTSRGNDDRFLDSFDARFFMSSLFLSATNQAMRPCLGPQSSKRSRRAGIAELAVFFGTATTFPPAAVSFEGGFVSVGFLLFLCSLPPPAGGHGRTLNSREKARKCHAGLAWLA